MSELFQDNNTSKSEVGVSFSSHDAAFVNALDEELKTLGISLLRYECSLEHQDRIDAFACHLASCNLTFVVLSEAYFESPYCFYELILLANVQEKAFLIVAEKIDVSAIAEKSFIKYERWSRNYTGANWIRSRLSEVDWSVSALQVSHLLSRKACPAFEALSAEGRRSYLKRLNWFPESFAQRLNTILSIDDLSSREKAFDEYLSDAYPNAPYLFARALSYEKSSHYDLALLYAERALSEDPSFSSAYVFVCRIASQATDSHAHEKAIKIVLDYSYLSSLVQSSDKAIVYKAQGLLELAKSNKADGALRAECLHAAQRFFEASLELEHDSTTLNNLAQIHEQLGNIEYAYELYSESINADPNNYAAMNNLALAVLRHLDDKDLAKGLFERALSINPSYSLAMNGLALSTETSNPKESLLCYLSMAAEQYNGSEAITNAATLLEEEFNESIAAGALYRIALNKNSHSIATNYNYAAYLRRSGGSKKLVERYLKSAVEVGCDETIVEFQLAMLEIRERLFSKAISRLNNLLDTKASMAAEFLIVYCLSIYRGKASDHIDLSADTTYWPLAAMKAKMAYDCADYIQAERFFEMSKSLAGSRIDEMAHDVSLVSPSLLFSVVDHDIPHLLGSRIGRKQISTINIDAANDIKKHIERFLRHEGKSEREGYV